MRRPTVPSDVLTAPEAIIPRRLIKMATFEGRSGSACAMGLSWVEISLVKKCDKSHQFFPAGNMSAMLASRITKTYWQTR
ncbi:hypothetical protein [Noviherbaspirillum aerium]|uniref:hypothetical protein n=1 Tax=Noviherbaspirillum aerium TaxID=2588497 RepID=UPI00124ECABA|nr:hypothetical protein [Noviherbaspirillum aerium]